MRFVKKVYFALSLIQIIIVPLFATEYPVRYLGIEDGLSNNAVTSVYQDHKGFMWFGTYDGLNRYDGYKFRIFRNKFGDSTTLVDNGVYTLADDPHHQLWVGARRGVCVFNPATEKFSIPRYQPANGESAQPINDNTHIIRSNENGIILIGTENKGLLQFTGSNTTGVQIPLAGRQTAYEVTAIKFVEKGNIAWVFVQHTGLCKYDVTTRRLTVINREITRGNCLTADDAGNIWLGTDTGVFRYLPSAGKYAPNALPLNSKVVNLYVDKAGVVWCGSDGNGIYLIVSPDKPGEPFTTPGSPQQLSSNAVYSLYEDRQGRKWVGTLRGGINIIEPKRNPFTLVTFNNSQSTGAIDNFIFSFCEDSHQHIWIGTDGGG